MAKRITATIKEALTNEQFDILLKVTRDVYFFSEFVYLIHPVRGKTQFKLYPFQKAVLYHFLTKRFNIILKFRQAGITELISLYCLWLAMYHPNKNVVILSLKERVAKKVLRKIKYMYRNLPDFLKVDIINGRPGELGTALEMEFANGSTISSIPTTEDAGRSEGVSLLVMDEAAIMKWAGLIWAAIFPTLSTGGNAIVNSCVTGDTNIITDKGPLRIDTICPPQFGKWDISKLGIRVLSHKGRYQRIVGAVNKGKLPTWEIVNNRGKTLKCTPDHKLLTADGWMPVKDIIAKGKKAIFYDFDAVEPPTTKPPVKEVVKRVKGYPNYLVSNLGKVYIQKRCGGIVEKKGTVNNWGYVSIKLWNNNKSKNFQRNRLVAQHFIGDIPRGYQVDHINCNKQDDYVTNLQITTVAKNSLRGAKYSSAHKLGAGRQKGSLPNLQATAYIQRRYRYYKKKGTFDFAKLIIAEVKDKYNEVITKVDVTRIGQGKRRKNIYTSKLKVIKKYVDNIYDISVEEDKSYFTDSQYVNHNTPYGIGNWYHKLWVNACSGGNEFFPIRLRWEMHPERYRFPGDTEWYDSMRAQLGPRKTAQEIDGDFLTSGVNVFDLMDIKAIEDELDMWISIHNNPELKVFKGGTLIQYKNPKPNEQYFIGSDVSTGRSRDYSAFSIMDRSGEEYASYKGKIHPSQLGDLLMEWGNKFNKALIAPEGNDIGLTTVSKIDDAGYPHLYYSRSLVKKKRKKKAEEKEIPGWYTTKQNRPVIISELEEDIRKDTIIIKDQRFVEEAYTFIYDERNRAVALGKGSGTEDDGDEDGEIYTDDSIMGKAITNHIRKGFVHKRIAIKPQ